MELNGHRILDTAGMMAYTTMCQSAVYAMVKAEDFPVIRLGRKLLVRSDLLDEWLMKHCSAGNEFTLEG